MQIVVFKLNDEQYAVETDKVKNISDAINITKVPNSKPYIVGLINLRGNIITMLNLNMLLNIKNNEKMQSNIIIVKMKDELVGISVDEVNEVLDIDQNVINPKDSSKDKPYIKGIIKFDNRVVTLIDIDKFILN